MAKLNIKINGVSHLVDEGKTILQAAGDNGVHIPTLCFLKDCCGVAECRMCIVETAGQPRPVPACVTLVTEGMEIVTDSDVLREYRRTSLDLMCRSHRMECEYCSRYSDCELHALMRELGLDERAYIRYSGECVKDESLPGFAFDSSKCLLCRRCVGMCAKQGLSVLAVLNKGSEARIGSYAPLADTDCIECGQCLTVCPTGAFYERNDMMTLWNVLENGKEVAMVLAPEVGKTVGECFGEVPGGNYEKKLIGLLRRIGIKKVYSAAYGEAVAAEEAARDSSKLSLSARCPAFANLVNKRYPQLSGMLSAIKSPLELTVHSLKGEDRFVVAVGGCSAGKAGIRNADLYMTVSELAAFIKRGCVSRFTAMDVWKKTAESDFDEMCCTAVSAGPEIIKSDKMSEIIGFLDKISSGELTSGRFEFVVCEGGCLMGGGTPRLSGSQRTLVKDSRSCT